MGLYYINGTPGSGKSTIREELERLGYEAHDADDPDIGGPYNRNTNQRVEYPDSPDKDWFEAHSWRLVPSAIESLREKAEHKTIFLCGAASNEDQVWGLFDQVFFLDIDEGTLRKRVANRTDNAYGKAPHELELIIDKYIADQKKRDRPDVILIDATLPINQIAESILEEIGRP